MSFRSVWLFLVLTGPSVFAAENWPQWRGPDGNSVSKATGLPVQWSKESGIVWKCPLPGEGNSTPAIWDDSIFVTAQKDDKLLLVKVHKGTGKIDWTREVGSGTAVRSSPAKAPKGEKSRGQQKFHNLHNLASPSPVTDGQRVFVHFGNGDLAAYDFAGQQLWQRDLQKEHGTYTIWWGHANSPVLYQDLVISICMQDSLSDLDAPPAASYLLAHDQKTGKLRWKALRQTKATAEQCDAYTTPIFHKTETGMELIVMGGNQLDAYDPATGKQLWFLAGLVGGRTITGPTLGNEMVYATQGMRGPLVAVKLGGKGELPESQIAWQTRENTPDSSCPVVWKDLLFFVADNGIATCVDARTGELKWKERLPGDYKASPLAAEGRVYFLNKEGLCTVVAAAPKFAVLARNPIEDVTLASPAISSNRIYLRGHKALYCVGKP
jgi:outer membrane protein assembly factor BamB